MRCGKREAVAAAFVACFLVLSAWELSYRNTATAGGIWRPRGDTLTPLQQKISSTDTAAAQLNTNPDPSSVPSTPAALEHPANAVSKTPEGSEAEIVVKKYDFKPESVKFVGNSSNLTPITFRLMRLPTVVSVEETACGERTEHCLAYNAFVQQLNQSSTDEGTVRIRVIPMDPLALMLKSAPNAYNQLIKSVVDNLSATRPYITYKGSDHLFVCLTDNCQDFAQDFAKRLAGDKGTRAIFAGVDLDLTQLEWPCPHRVIGLNRESLQNIKQLAETTVKQAAFMIEKANRWVCSDKQHPENYFGSHTEKMTSSGVFVKEFNMVLCQIPKSGSTMAMMLLRRLMHKKNWNVTTHGLPHNPYKSGVKYVNNDRDFDLMKEIYDEPTIIKAAIVRNPITRLLSGYLDKIDSRHEYGRAPQLKDYVKKHGHPTFPQFVNYLIRIRPNPDRLDQHFKTQSAKCGLRDHTFDFVGHLSELGSEFKEFSQSVGIWEEYVSTGWGDDQKQAFGEKSYQHNQHQSKKSIWDYYTEDLMRKVYRYYKEDFDRFGFSIEEMLKTKPESQS